MKYRRAWLCVLFEGGETEVFSNPLPPQNFEDFGEDDEGYDTVILIKYPNTSRANTWRKFPNTIIC